MATSQPVTTHLLQYTACTHTRARAHTERACRSGEVSKSESGGRGGGGKRREEAEVEETMKTVK